MTSINYDRRRARGGRGKLPANPNQWPYEHNGLDLRDELGLEPSDVLRHKDAYGLLPHVQVLPLGDIPAAAMHLEYLRTAGRARWSGFATRMDDGTELVVYNDSHSPARICATLMEELFHIRLEHERSQIRLLSDGQGGRSYNSGVEHEAYASGAAALVPFESLRNMVQAGMSDAVIARHFEVSTPLIEYRLKVNKLYRRRARSRRS